MKGRRILAAAMVMLFALAVALPVMAATSQVYATTNVNVRKGPSTRYAVLGYLTTNQVVTKVGASGSWTIINYSGGTAYVSSKYLKAYSGSSSASSGAAVANTSAPVYSGPGTSYSTLGTLTPSQNVVIAGTVGSWSIINWGSGTGYVYSSYLSAATSSSTGSSSLMAATTNVYVRTGPGSGYSTLGYLGAGQTVTKTGVYGDWTQVVYNGQTGYVQTAYLSAYTGSSSTASGMLIYATQSAYVYSNPSLSSSYFGQLSWGDSITYLGNTGSGWYMVQLGGRQGYVLSAYFTVPGGTGANVTATGTVYAISSAPVYNTTSTSGTVLGYLYQGQSAARTGTVGTAWTQVNYNGTTGYVLTSLLSVYSNYNTSGFTTLNTWMYSLNNYNYCYSVPTQLSSYQVGYLSQGEVVWANATNGTWLQILEPSTNAVMYVPAANMGNYSGGPGGGSNTTSYTYGVGSIVYLRAYYTSQPVYSNTSATAAAGSIPNNTTPLTVRSQVGSLVCVSFYNGASNIVGYIDKNYLTSTYGSYNA